MLLLLDGSMNIHSTTTGENLCKIQPEKEDLKYLKADPHSKPSLFLTEDIAGYIVHIPIYEPAEDYYDSSRYARVRIYDTKQGKLIKSKKILANGAGTMRGQSVPVLARGDILCFTCDDRELNVFQVNGKKLKKYQFYNHLDEFAKLKKLDELMYDYKITLMGFLSKTNVLIANLSFPSPSYQTNDYVFSLNLDVAIPVTAGAWYEEVINPALSMPVPANIKPAWYDSNSNFRFRPLYKTDRTTMSVELVGVMSEKDTEDNSEVVTIENNFFVTEILAQMFQ